MRLAEELFCIFWFNRAPIEQRNVSRIEVLSNVPMDRLSIIRSCCFACAYSPNRLIGNNKILKRIDAIKRYVELAADYFEGIARFTLLERLTNT